MRYRLVKQRGTIFEYVYVIERKRWWFWEYMTTKTSIEDALEWIKMDMEDAELQYIYIDEDGKPLDQIKP